MKSNNKSKLKSKSKLKLKNIEFSDYFKHNILDILINFCDYIDLDVMVIEDPILNHGLNLIANHQHILFSFDRKIIWVCDGCNKTVVLKYDFGF